MNKNEVVEICENLYKECLREIPQFKNGKLMWILNGSTLCNFLCNVKIIDGIEVSEEFTDYCYDFVRKPKGDIDITYRPIQSYKFDLENKYIKEFQRISEEQRTYNFVDSNSELTEDDYEELCTMETKSGLKFMAKKPEYLFLYKFKEFLAIFHNEILNNNLASINGKKKNILADVVNLYKIAIAYCGKDRLHDILNKLPKKSSYLSDLYYQNSGEYYRLINTALNLINSVLEEKNQRSVITKKEKSAVMKKLQFECKEYKLYSPDSLKYITDNMHDILIKKIKEYQQLFDIKELEQIQINFFDDINKFRSFIYDLRGESASLPEYAVGTFDNGMINAFIDKDILTVSDKYMKKIYMASHELFHILYRKYVYKNGYNRIVWYDEGMAQFMSGEKDHLLDIDKFKKYYFSVKENTKEIPNINEIKHGNSFKNELYNGYDISYLCVKYLNEILNENEFRNLMTNFDKIRDYGNTIVEDMFCYYDSKLKIGGKFK